VFQTNYETEVEKKCLGKYVQYLQLY
jgi:hypothetical protein